jgi:hypothetical protein
VTQGGEKFSEKKSAVAAFQPQLVVMDDDDRGTHGILSSIK